MHALKILMTCAFLTALVACGETTEGPTEATVDADAGAPDQIEIPPIQGYDPAMLESAGKPVYVENCQSCHEGQVAKAPHRSMLNIMSAESVYRALTEGVMQDQSEHLSDEDKKQVSEYVTGRRLGTKSAANYPMCEGEAAAFDHSAPPYGTNWGMTKGNTRLITTERAGLAKEDFPKLKLKWAFAYPDTLRARSQPTLAAGAIFVGSHNGTVFAIDQKSGCVRWTFVASAEVRTGIAIDMWEAGDASAKPQLHFGDLLGNVYAWMHRPESRYGGHVPTITPTPPSQERRRCMMASSSCRYLRWK